MTKISLKTGSSLDEFYCTNESGLSLTLGQNGKGVGPMQAVLMAVAGCSTIDVLMILKKMRQDVQDVKVDVEGIHREEIPRIYNKINLHFVLTGKIKEVKASEAIALSLEKYCSVSKMLEKSAEITSSFEIIGSS